MPDNYIIRDGELYHFGVKGMKWGVRKQKLIDPSPRKVKKNAKKDHKSMTDQEFKNKYSVSKKTYTKRVKKYGDPSNSPMAKMGKKMAKDPKVAALAIAGTAAAGIALASYGSSKISNFISKRRNSPYYSIENMMNTMYNNAEPNVFKRLNAYTRNF